MNARFDKPNELTVGWQSRRTTPVSRQAPFKVDGKIDWPRGAAERQGAPRRQLRRRRGLYDYVEAKVPFSRAARGALDVVVTGGFQGRKDDSIRYPSVSKPCRSAATADPASAPRLERRPRSEQDRYVDRIVNGLFGDDARRLFLAGLALSLTPCVADGPDPSSIIAGQAVPCRRAAACFR